MTSGELNLRMEYWKYAIPIIRAAHKDTGYFQTSYTNGDGLSIRGSRIGGFLILCSGDSEKSRVELHLSASGKPDVNRSAYDYLLSFREEIEAKMGAKLRWYRSISSNSSFVTHWNPGLLIENRSHWERLAEYHARMSKKLYDVMAIYLKEWNDKNHLVRNTFPLSLKTNGAGGSIRDEYWKYAMPIIQAAHKDTEYFQNSKYRDNVWQFGEEVDGFKFSCAANRDKSRVELDLMNKDGEINSSAFDYLYEHRNEIEKKMGDILHWSKDKKSCFVTHWNLALLIENRSDWEQLAKYHASMSRKLYEVMTPYLAEWNTANRINLRNFPPVIVPAGEILDIHSIDPQQLKYISNDKLKKLAEQYSVETPEKLSVSRQEYRRNLIISDYAKRRAHGFCQLCGRQAPFMTPDGEPYLEVHHIKWLKDGGADSIDNTVALCPNCHRKMHSLNLPEDVKKLQKIAVKH